MTTFDLDTTEQDLEPFLHVRRAFGGRFALNAWAGRSGRLAEGDPVTLIEEPVPVATPAAGRYAA